MLEAPSEPFTRQRWKLCSNVEEAVKRHREIFFEWAFRSPQAELFRGLVGKPTGPADFFRRLYITDIWKDAAFGNNRNPSNPQYEYYWRKQLQIEIASAPANRVIFVGSQAWLHGCDYVPIGIPRHRIPFPSHRNKEFKPSLKRMLAELSGEGLMENSHVAATEEQPGDAQFVSAAKDRNWILNDAINRNKFGVIPFDQSEIQMNLSYQKSRASEIFFIATFRLGMHDLQRNGLVRKVTSGFWLRFVRDPVDSNIYIQINQSSPRLLVGRVPPAAG